MNYIEYTIQELKMINEEILDVLIQRLIENDTEYSKCICPPAVANQYGKLELLIKVSKDADVLFKKRFIEDTNTLIFH